MRKLTFALIGVLVMVISISTVSFAAGGKKKILVVMSYEKPSANPWCKEIKEGIDSVLASTFEITYFYMDTKKNLSSGPQKAEEVACEMLNTLGYKAKAVSSGEKAVEYLKKHTVDLIVLDMIMEPGINGRETYERIIKFHPNQKAIIASGFSDTDDVKAAQMLGAGEYIKKPYTLEKIGIAVRNELKKEPRL